MTQTIVHVPASEGGGSFDPTDITIADNTSPAFLVQDSSTEYIRIDTTTGNSRIQIDTGIANQAFSIKESREIQLRCGANNQFLLSGDNTIDAYAHTFNHRQFSGGKFRSLDAGGSAIFQIDEDSTTTFTLDDGTGSQFKVVNNAGSPKTFISVTDGGSTILDCESSTIIRGQGSTYITANASELQLGASGKYVIHHNGYPLYKRSPNLLDLGATSGTTVVNLQSNGAYKKIKCNPSTSSQTFTLEFQDGSSANRDYVVEQDFAIHNNGSENCTIQATITSGRGSALGKDLSAGGSTSGELVSGMTLNAGKSALFKAVKWNKELAGTATSADNEFMFQTIMVEA